MPDPNGLRGSMPVYSAKEILQHLDAKVDGIDRKVDDLVTESRILGSQNLDGRLKSIEQWQNRLIGLAGIGAILGLVATVLAIVNRPLLGI